MRVSILTICFNSAETITDTINSVIGQSYNNIEFIIKDGGSKDKTLEIVENYKEKIATIKSEPDGGIYPGMNQALALATGDIIGILNSDDLYAYPEVIEEVVKEFENTNSDALYADLVYVDKNDTNKIIRTWKSGPYKKGLFLKGWMPPHPTFFVKKEVYEKYGVFNTKLKSAADYEIMLRFIHKHQIKLAYLPKVVVKMRTGGMSNVSLKNRIKANLEDREAWRLNNLKPNMLTLYQKPLSKLLQFVKRKKE
jgi:glycosyltransferase involved in cell wall biosynthesis